MTSVNDTKSESRNMLIVVLGVCGSGKTTIGEALSTRLGWSFADADGFHSKANIIKMSSGQPLTDQDRIPWLLSMHKHLSRLSTNGEHGIVACSALKRIYRSILCNGVTGTNQPYSDKNTSNHKLDIKFVHLTGSKTILEARLCNRLGHFMPATLLQSQLDTLEELSEEETGVCVDVQYSTDEQVQKIITELAIHA